MRKSHIFYKEQFRNYTAQCSCTQENLHNTKHCKNCRCKQLFEFLGKGGIIFLIFSSFFLNSPKWKIRNDLLSDFKSYIFTAILILFHLLAVFYNSQRREELNQVKKQKVFSGTDICQAGPRARAAGFLQVGMTICCALFV